MTCAKALRLDGDSGLDVIHAFAYSVQAWIASDFPSHQADVAKGRQGCGSPSGDSGEAER